MEYGGGKPGIGICFKRDRCGGEWMWVDIIKF